MLEKTGFNCNLFKDYSCTKSFTFETCKIDIDRQIIVVDTQFDRQIDIDRHLIDITRQRDIWLDI